MTPESASAEPTRSLEIELTFDVGVDTPVPSWQTLGLVVSVDGPEWRELDAQYFDVDDVTLGRAGYAVRRRTGGPDEGWHIKGPKDADGARVEQHWPLGAPGVPPAELIRVVIPIAPTAGEPGAVTAWGSPEGGADQKAHGRSSLATDAPVRGASSMSWSAKAWNSSLPWGTSESTHSTAAYGV